MDNIIAVDFDKAARLFDAGGPVVLILAVLSVIALTLFLLKLWQFHSARLFDRRNAEDAVSFHRSGQTDRAIQMSSRSLNPVSQSLARALNGQKRGVPEHLVREESYRYGADALETLRSGMRPLEVIASTAPLLGLFGTVLGMISAFQQLENAGSQVNPAILSGGIWEALLTTAVGLAVAIPTVAAHSWLDRVVDRTAHDIENTVTKVFTEDLSDMTLGTKHADTGNREPATVLGA